MTAPEIQIQLALQSVALDAHPGWRRVEPQGWRARWVRTDPDARHTPEALAAWFRAAHPNEAQRIPKAELGER